MGIRVDSRSWLWCRQWRCSRCSSISLLAPLRSFSDPAWGLQNWLLIDRPVYLRPWATRSWSCTVTAATAEYPPYTMANAGLRLRRLLVFAVLIPF
jgi:hypothetical protein